MPAAKLPNLGMLAAAARRETPAPAELRSRRASHWDNSPSFSADRDSDLSDTEDHWAAIKKKAVAGGEWELANRIEVRAAPVRYARTGANARRDQLPYEQLRELCKAEKDFGRNSPYFKNLIQATFAANILIPHDIKNIMSCLLSPSEYMLWERSWKRLLQDLLQSYQRDPNRANLTFDQLCGQGDFMKPQDQIRVLSELILDDVKRSAEKALMLTPCRSTPSHHFSTIKQAFDEPFMKFIDRLKESIEKQVDNLEAQKELLCVLAMANGQ